MTLSSTLRSYLEDGQSRLVAGSYDAMTAKLAAAAGFEIVYVSGYGASAAMAGLPDVGLLTMTEMVENCGRICAVVGVPVIADADTGYGNVLNVRRTVREFEAAGAAGIHLEDQVSPKRCGHMRGKRLVAPQEMENKLQVALHSRRDDEFVIIARTDAIAVEGIDGAIRRGVAYQNVGADVLFVDAPESIEQIERIAHELSPPLLFDWSYDGVTPHVSRAWLSELGFNLVLFPDVVSAAHCAVRAFLDRLKQTDSLDELSDALTPFDELNDFVGLPDWAGLERDCG